MLSLLQRWNLYFFFFPGIMLDSYESDKTDYFRRGLLLGFIQHPPIRKLDTSKINGYLECEWIIKHQKIRCFFFQNLYELHCGPVKTFKWSFFIQQ